MSHDIVNLEIAIVVVLNNIGIVGRELQVLLDGLLTQTIDITDIDQTNISIPLVDIAGTITIELRDINEDGGMSSPLIYEFMVVDGDIPAPLSDYFTVHISRN